MFPLAWNPRGLAFNAYRRLRYLLPWSKSPRGERVEDDCSVCGVDEVGSDEHPCSEFVDDDDERGARPHGSFITKSCALAYNHNGMMAEPYLLSNPKLLEPLQGSCVPRLLGMWLSEDGSTVTYDLETFDSLRQRLLRSALTEEEKQSIVQAYETIHARNVLHGDVSFDNILFDEEGRVMITEFGQGCCLASIDDPDIDMDVRCERCELEYEMRHVKFMLDYKDSRRSEYTLTDSAAGRRDGRVFPFLGLGFDVEKPFYIPRRTLEQWRLKAAMAITPWSFTKPPMYLLTSDTTSQNESSDSLWPCNSPANLSPPISSPSLSLSSDSYYHGSTSSLPLRRKRSFRDTVSGMNMTRASESHKCTRDGRRRAISMDDALWPPQITLSSPSPSIPLASSSSSPSSPSSYNRPESSTSTSYSSSNAYSAPPSPVLLLSEFMQLDPDDVPFAKSGPGTIGMWFPLSPAPSSSGGVGVDGDRDGDVASDQSEFFSSDEDEDEDEVEAGYESRGGGTRTTVHRPIKWGFEWDAENDETAVQRAAAAEEDFDPPMHTKLSPSTSSSQPPTSESSIPYEIVHGPQTATWYRVPDDRDADADSNTPGYVSFEPMSVTLIDVSSEGRRGCSTLPRSERASLSMERMQGVTEKGWRGRDGGSTSDGVGDHV